MVCLPAGSAAVEEIPLNHMNGPSCSASQPAFHLVAALEEEGLLRPGVEGPLAWGVVEVLT